jgi:hypothetical protein
MRQEFVDMVSCRKYKKDAFVDFSRQTFYGRSVFIRYNSNSLYLWDEVFTYYSLSLLRASY